MAAQFYELTKNYSTVHFQNMNFMVLNYTSKMWYKGVSEVGSWTTI